MIGGVTCPECGKDNPDFLDNCQFCQAVLRTESTLNIGENPTKKVTGDLEPILPDWLRDARQQGRDSAEDDARQEATKPKIQKDEPLDLLAGLAFEAASNEDEVPDWLAAINPVEKQAPTPSKPVEKEPSDFFAQFNQPVKDAPAPEPQKDELTGWLPEASGQPGEPFAFDSGTTQDENAWLNNLGAPAFQEPTAWNEPVKPAEPEDLGWLHDLESSTKQQPATPQADTDWMANLDPSPTQVIGEQDDMSWLNNLGGTPIPSFDAPAPAQPAQPASSQEDLSWLNNMGGTPAPSFDAPAQPASSQEDLSWLNNLGGTPAPSFDTPAQPASAQEDLSWLNNMGSTSAPSFDAPAPAQPAQPASSQEDLSWLNNMGGTPAPSFDAPAPAQPASSQEDLSWLSNLGGTPAPSFDTPASSFNAPAQPASAQEDLSWLNNMGGTPAPSFDAPASSQEDLGWLNNLGGEPASSFDAPAPAQPASSQEDLSWLNNMGGTPAPSFDAPAQPASSQEDLSWLNNMGGTPAPSFDTPAQPASSQEDLSWLNNMGSTPAPSFDTPPQPASSQEDLSWLNNMGGTPAPTFDAPAQPASSQEDLDWLNNLSGTPAPSFDAPAQPASSQEDLSWLNNMAGTPAPSFDTLAPAQPASSQEDLDWLNNLGGTPAPSFDASAQPASSQEDLDWLNNLGGTPAPSTESAPEPFVQSDTPDWLKDIDSQLDAAPPPAMFLLNPRQTAPLSEEAVDSMPDWLKSATEGSSVLPMDATTSMDWSTSKDKPADEAPLRFDDVAQPTPVDQTQGLPASVDQGLFSTPSDSSSLSNQDIDSLFAVDMPDWLSQAEPADGSSSALPGGIPSGVDDSLAPVSLPSWVQAMRPVEAAISDVSAVSVDQNTEQAGPLAGLRGVIPFAPIGSALRPKSISLKLQATDEQQTSAALLEQIIAGETTAHPLKTTPFVAAQRTLRWVLSAIFVIGLGVMIGLGTTQMPVSAALPIAVSDASNVVATMPDEAPVLVVIDYEPALSGEMEAVAGPLLDQMTVLRRPTYSFVSTSPNGSALVERLLTNTKISQPAPDGLGYQAGDQYFNLGYLPGGSAGVRGFTEQPKVMLPAATITQFSDYAAVIVITDHAESGLVWIEQLELMKQTNPALANQPLLVLASAQAGPLLQPYVSSKQVAGMVNGLSDAARYEFVNNSRPGIARSYWDAFGVGLFMAIVAIVLGSLWSLFMGMRARRAEAEQG